MCRAWPKAVSFQPHGVPEGAGSHGGLIASAPHAYLEERTGGARHHVQLSPDVRTALAVGTRDGVPVMLDVDVKRMHRQGHMLFVAENGAGLTDAVPVECLMERDTPAR